MKRALSNLRFTLAAFRSHPLAQGRFFRTLGRYVRWQIGSRLVPGPVLVPWVNGTRLIIAPGMWGATMNHYCGLQDFEAMAFLLHLLRPDDVFMDVGANVGVYSVLASGAAGAKTIAVEPGEAAGMLETNIRLNGLAGRVEMHRAGAGAAKGVVRFTQGLDTLNHIVAASESFDSGAEIPITTIDLLAGERCPTAIKLDTEGYETPAVQGAADVMRNERLLALCVELDGHGPRYGYDEPALHARFLALGFAPHRYCPFDRKLEQLPDAPPPSGNVLYLRTAALAEIRRRLASATAFEVLGRRI